MNLFSSKERLFENEFSIDGGIITATIETKGKIQELVIPSTITVNDKLVFNNKDITSQLETNELLKTLSSQSDLSLEQINLIKEIANNDQWHTTTTTLSGLGALIVQVIVTVITSGAGTAIVAGLSQTVTQAAVQTAVEVAMQAALKAAVQAIVVQATSSLLTSVITGNKFKLDIKSLAKSAITAGVLSYASGLKQLKLNDLNLGEITQQFAQKAIDTSIKTGIQSAVYGTDFKDSLGTNLVMAGTDLIAKVAFKKVGTTSMKKGEVEQNDSYKDGGLAKTAIHSLTGGAIAAIKGENVLAGALSAGAREAISPLTKDSSNKTQLLVSQLTGITVGALVNGQDGAKTGMSIANSGELYNRQLHQNEIRFIKNNSKDFASKLVSINLVGKQYTISDKQARKILFEASKYMIDNNSKEKTIDRLKYVVVQGVSRKDLIAGIRYLEQNSKGLSIQDVYKQSMKPQAYFTSTSAQFKDSSWTPDTTQGLGDSSDILFITAKPIISTAKTLINTSKVVSPVLVKGGTKVINKAGQGYDDVTLGAIKKINKIAPSVGNVILDPKKSAAIIGGVEIVNDVFNESMPATTKSGQLYNIYDQFDKAKKNIKIMFDKEK